MRFECASMMVTIGWVCEIELKKNHSATVFDVTMGDEGPIFVSRGEICELGMSVFDRVG